MGLPSSTLTPAGTQSADALGEGNIKEAGGVVAITIDSAGEVTKIGQDVPADGEVLTWNAAGSKVLWAAGGGGGGSGHTIQNGGVSLANRTNLNFDGTHLVATDDAGNDQTDVTVSAALQSWSGKSAPTGDVVGTTDTQTLSNKTLTEPKFADTGFIADASGAAMLQFDSEATAVNHITISNVATGDFPEVRTTSGTDADVHLGLIPQGAGHVIIGADGSAVSTVTSDGASDLALSTNNGTNSGTITITDGVDQDITLAPNGTGKVAVGPGTGAGVLMSNGTQNLQLMTSGTGPTVLLTDGANGGVTFTPDGTGAVTVAGSSKLELRNGNSYINSPSDDHLDIVADEHVTIQGAPSVVTDLGTSSSTIGSVFTTTGDGTGTTYKYLNDTLVKGSIYYLTSGGAWAEAHAENSSTGVAGDLLGVALGTNSSTDGLLMEGLVRINHGAYDGTAAIGKVGYLRDDNGHPGEITFTKPTSSGHFIRVLGNCVQVEGGGTPAIVFRFNPSSDYVELA